MVGKDCHWLERTVITFAPGFLEEEEEEEEV